MLTLQEILIWLCGSRFRLRSSGSEYQVLCAMEITSGSDLGQSSKSDRYEYDNGSPRGETFFPQCSMR